MSSKNKITLIFIVNGVDVRVEENIHEPLRVARDRALRDSNNTGRHFDEWDVHDAGGQSLDPNKKIEELGLTDGTRLFLNLRVGAGGK